jgi:hypothetical protein
VRTITAAATENTKKRINITVDDRVYEAMERLSIERDQSVAGVVRPISTPSPARKASRIFV